MKVAIVGAGWAGMAAAVAATQAGHSVTVLEAARSLGGRARAVAGQLPDGTALQLDNGQHILIGAYRDTLRLMQQVGLNPAQALLRLPLTLQFPDGQGLALPRWPSPLDALAGVLRANGWTWADKASLLKATLAWQRRSFTCAPQVTVAELCRSLSPRVMQTLIEPLCVSALNTPADRASGQVFLTVLRDSLFAGTGGSHLLLPRTDLTTLFPQAAAAWVQARGGSVRFGERVATLQSHGKAPGWQVNGMPFDAVVWATSASHAIPALMEYADSAPESIAASVTAWLALAQTLRFEAITTVYAWAPSARLVQPMLALHSSERLPAQFVFDRGQLGGPPGLLAFVVSASAGERDTLQTQVLAQAQTQLSLRLQPVLTVVEKRATFACTPGLRRPPVQLAPGLLACGDYLDGPYPATLEGAVRSGLAAIKLL